MAGTVERIKAEKEAERLRQKNQLVQGRIPWEERARGQAILNRHGLSWSDFIRSAVQQLIREHPGVQPEAQDLEPEDLPENQDREEQQG